MENEKWQQLKARISRALVAMAERAKPWAETTLARLRASRLGRRLAEAAPTDLLQKQGYVFYGKIATLVLCTYFLSDLTALLAEKAIPEPPISRGSFRRESGSFHATRTLESFQVIFSRNLFNSRGIIPGEAEPSGPMQDTGGVPTKTTLPLNLIGTIILENEIRSIAMIEDKSDSTVYPMRQQDEIQSKIRVLKIEASRVTFINLASGRTEFVDLPEDAAPKATRISLGGGRKTGVSQTSPTQFYVSRAEVDRALGADFNKVLTEARAVPNFENGVASGYKLFQIVPGSIYSKLGLQEGDVIQGLNGEPINDPGKAFALLSELKTANHLELQVKRGGKTSTNSYDIN